MVKVEQCKKKFYNLGVKPFMNMIVSSRKEQQTLVMELNMTSLNSIFYFIVELQYHHHQINTILFQSSVHHKREDLDSDLEDKR
jgi:hypothetical protein